MRGDTSGWLRERLKQAPILAVPGAADALTARIIEQAGFEAVYATGAGISNSLLGLPDLGLATMTELLEQTRRMVAAINVPLIADIDTGYGNPVNVVRTVREFERAGVAAVQIEDQVSPKRCGHFEGKEVVPADEMVLKIQAACAARQNPGMLIIARTDSIATGGFDDAIKRGRAYAAAGADVIFVEAPRSVDELRALPTAIDAPLLVNMTEGGNTPLVSAADLQAMGFKIAIFPNAALRVAMYAVRTMLAELHHTGTTEGVLDRMETWANRQRTVGIAEYQDFEKRFVQAQVNAD